MARLSASILSNSIRLSLTVVGSVLLLGAVPEAQQPRLEANIAINQFEDDLLPRLDGEPQMLANPNDSVANDTDVNEADTVNAEARTQFLLIQAAFAAAVGLSALALAYGVWSYSKYHRWQRIEFLRRATREFENDPGVAKALSILDFEEYRDYPISTFQTTADAKFKVTNELLSRALANHAERKDQKQRLENLSPNLEHQSSALTTYYAETSVRDWFNQMLNGLEHFGYLVDSRVFSVKEIKPWLNYWVRLIADENYRRNCDSRVYDQLYNYIFDHGFDGVRSLFEKFGYRIVRSPYKETDFKRLGDVTKYSTRLALSLAKTSRLIYQDMTYVTEISDLWDIDIRNNFRYFNNKQRDTQAVIFRTDECMVLAFRGSQEIRDWYTNFNTQLRNFTIRKAGKTTLSSYKGHVHTGFFLAWASIEKAVLAQIYRWQNEEALKQNSKLPPLLITGHSLGGALATMAAASLHENGIDVAGLYTFGQPRVGDIRFTRQLNNNLDGKVFRFVNNNDVVPHIPPPFSLHDPLRLYGHLGTVRYFNSKGLLMTNYKTINRILDSLFSFGKSLFESSFDLIADHGMPYYISYLDKALEEELKDKAATVLELDINRVGGAEAANRLQKK
ncbi:lipase family protein [Leptolyngbya cf. ectocarpi LEGE 11479]|uniref:Lipase family protein n=1 Tax=Leptolyngbya cf. ectocarpi LEGE 11479 TaxID=1828722 RepID=A0A929FA41_LEPEC|nr:lipase family protein [Leptolyngbya ectocarpi]MBE9069726.1 lipase family protein [Leptolyngbya cf. ectocarpi LEGE 11479]